MAVTPRLNRAYMYVPLDDLNFDFSTADVHQVAFKTDPELEPDEQDWVEAIVVDSNHDLYRPDIGDALAILIGPDRGDSVTSEELAADTYLVWVDLSAPGTDERIVDWAGEVEVVAGWGG